MSGLNWQKAHSTHKAWAYSRSAPIATAPPRHTRKPTAIDWQRSRLQRRIDALTARIASGRSWLDTVPSTDQRYTLWSRKINELRAERARLQGMVDRLKMAHK